MHVLTGAPGTGKTTLLRRLGDDFVTVDEPARQVLAELRANTGTADSEIDPATFVGLLLERSIDNYTAHAGGDRVVFDRGIPDCVAYAWHLDLDASDSLAAARRYRHTGSVLMLTPWEEIYTTDEERTMGFDLVEKFHGHLVAAYHTAGYDIVEVPMDTIDARVAFVLDTIDNSGGSGSGLA